jgi:hypothetical protein
MRLLSLVEHRSAQQQAELAVNRARDAILRARTLFINSARSIVKGFGLRLPKSNTGSSASEPPRCSPSRCARRSRDCWNRLMLSAGRSLATIKD